MLKRITFTFLVSLALLPALAVAGITIGSFNVLHLGWDNGKRYDQLAQVAVNFDLVAFQEVMTEAGLETLIRNMDQASGEEWQYIVSHAIGRGSYREMYAIAWRESAVEYAGGAVVYLDGRDVFSREPLLAKFRSKATGQELALADIHLLYGDGMADREPEIRALADIWDWMAEVYPSTPRIIAGDFNSTPTEKAWSILRERGAVPAIEHGASTLSPHEGRYVHLYDNLWYEAGKLNISDRGVLNYPEILGIPHKQARDTVSDHAPVYAVLNGGDPDVLPRPAHDLSSSSQSASDCIDLNRSSTQDLERLPNIGEAYARAIENGRPWASAAALDSIRGIGPARLADIVDSGLLCEG